MYKRQAYNGEKINEAQGRLLTTNRIYNDGSGTVDIGKAMEMCIRDSSKTAEVCLPKCRRVWKYCRLSR